MGRSDVTARAKREARWRERAGVPSARAGVFGVRQRRSSRGGVGTVGAGQPAQTGGRQSPWARGTGQLPVGGWVAWARGGRGRGEEGWCRRGRQGSPVGGKHLGRNRRVGAWGLGAPGGGGCSTEVNFWTYPDLAS